MFFSSLTVFHRNSQKKKCHSGCGGTDLYIIVLGRLKHYGQSLRATCVSVPTLARQQKYILKDIESEELNDHVFKNAQMEGANFKKSSV